ncbi:hypothetical protein TURU_088106 [Turdus rufiventris]|nr:hypothetical protein TURU_088106 [Turdus rufiventris]
MKLRIEGDHKAHVGLVAVDKGVFVLSKKNKLTQTRVWDTVERSDIGCTAGSGRDNIGVFTDAGLSLVTNVHVTTPQRSDGVQEERVKSADLSDIVPDTESETKVSIQGNPVSIIVEKSIDGSKLKHLIVTPSGCGEQNMIGLTPTVIAVHYLDQTLQWENFGVDRRAGAIELIRKGYTQQLAFRKPDSSYAAFISRASSTWLTAYVVKVFAMARRLVDIEHNEICGPIKWLILNKQKPDGLFQEDAPVMSKPMTGGYHGAEPEVSLTAFVLIALKEARDTCKDHVNSLDQSIEKAANFLSRRYEHLARPYTVALTSYALALAGKLNSEKVLMKHSKGGSSWEEYNARTYNIEGTSYALLALLAMKKWELAGPVVRWLAQQNYYGGGYGSTQATILVFQALAQYQVSAEAEQQLELDVSVLLPRRANPVKYRIENRNALVARSTEVPVLALLPGIVTVTVTVIGTVTLYKVKLVSREETPSHDNYIMEVLTVIKMGMTPGEIFSQPYTQIFGSTPPVLEGFKPPPNANDIIQWRVLLIVLSYLTFGDKGGLSWITTLIPTPGNRDGTADIDPTLETRDSAPEHDPATQTASERMQEHHHRMRWKTLEEGIQQLREVAVLEVLLGRSGQHDNDPDKVRCTGQML